MCSVIKGRFYRCWIAFSVHVLVSFITAVPLVTGSLNIFRDEHSYTLALGCVAF